MQEIHFYWTNEQECTRWNVSPSLLIIDIMLTVLNIKLYYNSHINLTWSNKIRSRSYKLNEKYIYVHLTIIQYTEYSGNIAKVFKKQTSPRQLNIDQWTMKMRSIDHFWSCWLICRSYFAIHYWCFQFISIYNNIKDNNQNQMLHRAQLYTTAEVEPWTVGASMDKKFKLDTALNLDCD